MTTRFESVEGGSARFVAEKGKYLPYPAYRDSGVEWLGVIPSHWEVKRLKRVATWNDEVLPDWTDPDLELTYVDIGSVDALDGIVEKSYLRFGSAPTRARRVVRDGDVIVSTVRTYLRAITPIAMPEPNLIASTGFAVIRPRDIDGSFTAYVVRAPYFVDNVVANSIGVSYPAINANELVLASRRVPYRLRTTRDCCFLDRETAKIDALVAKKERLIELLQEKRTALITRAVTKGLDPDVPMKDSGIDWLGEIPAHWKKTANQVARSTCSSGYGCRTSTDDVSLESIPEKSITMFPIESVEPLGSNGVHRVGRRTSCVAATVICDRESRCSLRQYSPCLGTSLR